MTFFLCKEKIQCLVIDVLWCCSVFKEPITGLYKHHTGLEPRIKRVVRLAEHVFLPALGWCVDKVCSSICDMFIGFTTY